MDQLQIMNINKILMELNSTENVLGSLVIANENEFIYSKDFGKLHSVKTEITSSTDPRYRIGSISKLYTATMLLQLIEEGKLSFDER